MKTAIQKKVEFHEGINLPRVDYYSGKAILQIFVNKKTKWLSVFTAIGTQKDIVSLVKRARREYPKYTISDQVSNQTELKAMYRAGLRVIFEEEQVKELQKSLELLEQRGSVYMELGV